MRYVLACLVCTALLLAGCQTPPAAPAATSAPAGEAVATEEMTAVPEAAATEEMAATPEAGASEEMTSTEEMTETEGITPTEELTSTEGMTTAAVSVPFEVIQIIQEYDPGVWAPPHSHGGPGMATVIEGQVTLRKGAAGEEETVYGPGEFFDETPGEILNPGNAGQEQVQIAVMFLLPQGAILTTPVTGTAMADMPPGPTVLSRTTLTITEDLGNYEVVQLVLDFAPGTATPLHSHGGHGLVTVIEGEVTHTPEATGEEMVYGPGEFFIETPGALHVAGNAGQENARLAAIFLLPEGASLTTVQEGTSSDDLPPGPTVVSRTSFSVSADE